MVDNKSIFKQGTPKVDDIFPKEITTTTKILVFADGSSRVISNWSTVRGHKSPKPKTQTIISKPVIEESVEL